MLTDPKPAENKEIKEDCDGNKQHIQPSPSTKQYHDSPGRDAAQTSVKQPVVPPKKISMWKKGFQNLKFTGQISNPKSKALELAATMKPPSPETTTSPPSSRDATRAASLNHLINADLSHIEKEALKLQKYNARLHDRLQKLKDNYVYINNLTNEDEKIKQLDQFRVNLIKEKLTIPVKYKIGDQKRENDNNLGFISVYSGESPKVPQLHHSPTFETSPEFKDFEARFMELEYHVMLCLLCFSIFPQDAIIKKRLMLQWWFVEGFASSEKVAVDYFQQLLEKGFIEPVNNNRSLTVGSCRVLPFHRSALVALAERAKLFNFGSGGDPTQNFSGSFQGCLMGEGLISYRDFKDKNKEEKGDPVKVIDDLIKQLEKLHLLINVDEHILEFKEKWFAMMKNLNFLYLGRWKALATHHIEVEDSRFLEGLGNMKYVKFLSLQGVSNIITLPKSILKLTNLDMLDLRACSNLESVPDEIGCLTKLTHLDMSECYLLVHMPKTLSQLTNLKVLKGFFVSQEEKRKDFLKDLLQLRNLEKLCIYSDRPDFPNANDIKVLEGLTDLIKLTITWGVREKKEEEKEKKGEQGSASASGKLPPNLKKLDLKCFPMEETPDWLKLKNLKGSKLEKLYIRGGKFSDLGQYQGINEKWTVEVLRLKYLRNIEMEWRELHELFPKLKYLEKLSCPNLTLFPCDAKGVWIKQQ